MKALTADRCDEGYEPTRAFNITAGSTPFEELGELWVLASPTLQMVKNIRPASEPESGSRLRRS
jgi:hypothetical protein